MATHWERAWIKPLFKRFTYLLLKEFMGFWQTILWSAHKIPDCSTCSQSQRYLLPNKKASLDLLPPYFTSGLYKYTNLSLAKWRAELLSCISNSLSNYDYIKESNKFTYHMH